MSMLAGRLPPAGFRRPQQLQAGIPASITPAAFPKIRSNRPCNNGRGYGQGRQLLVTPCRAAQPEFQDDFEDEDEVDDGREMPSEMALQADKGEIVRVGSGNDDLDDSDSDDESLWGEDEEYDDLTVVDNSYEIRNKYNTNPDLSDPDWPSKVSNWAEFWNHTDWGSEIEEHIGSEHAQDEDAGGKVVSPGERARMLVSAINDLKLRSDVVQWLPAYDPKDHFGVWEFPPISPEGFEKWKIMELSDARAKAEKRERHQLMDIEWRRRKALVGKFNYADAMKDVRRQNPPPSTPARENLTDEDVMNMITNDGLLADPKNHGAVILNPLLPTDLTAGTFPVEYIEETEDFLHRIGHLATPEDVSRFEMDEIMIDAAASLNLSDRDLERLLTAEEMDDDEGWDDGELTMTLAVGEDGEPIWDEEEEPEEEEEEEEEGEKGEESTGTDGEEDK